jgi:uncharacterized protein (UPF0276 family)
MPVHQIGLRLRDTMSIDEKRHALPSESVGIGLKPEHAADILSGLHDIDFFEIHAETYMGAGGPPHHMLREVRGLYPLSLHGVGLSIGAARGIDREHLTRLRRLIDRYRPCRFSEHLAWSTHDGCFLNDLLPLPCTDETLARVCEHIDIVQSTLDMRMLLENPSTYVTFECATMSETDFLCQVAERTACGLLLDVNNVYVAALNHGFEPMAYIDAFPLCHVDEIHLAGFTEDRDDDNAPLLIDAHGTPVAEAVWSLYRRTIARTGPIPTLIEWDNDVPSFTKLAAEAAGARTILTAHMQPWRKSAA